MYMSDSLAGLTFTRSAAKIAKTDSG